MTAEPAISTLILLTCLAFVAGFIDSVAGGGGLIQLPSLLIFFPKTPLPALFGTNKISALAGTSFAAWRYSKHVRFDYKLLVIISLFSLVSSYTGARTVSLVNPDYLKPVVFGILILIAIYTFLKKNLGAFQKRELTDSRKLLYGSLLGTTVGFYDGFLGPGTGSFLVLGFVVVLGFEFITASAYSKIINCVTNISALFVFVRQGNFIPSAAIVMAFGNIAGNITGSYLAIKKGNRFIRLFFLIVVSLLILRYGFDIFKTL